MKVKITRDGQPCRKCGTAVVKKVRNPLKPVPENQAYYFKSFFDCPKCHNRYMNDADKVYSKDKAFKVSESEKTECKDCQFKIFFESLKITLGKV